MNFDLSRIRGVKQSIQENFELLICQLLVEEMKAVSIEGKGGDGGIDCFIRKDNGELEVFQVKYFRSNLTSSQKSQIKKSFTTASRDNALSKWILCIPKDHTPAEKVWFESISSRIKIEWWGETIIRNLLSKHAGIAAHFFPDDEVLEKLNEIRIEIKELFSRKDIKIPNTLPRTTPFFTGRKNEIAELRKVIFQNLLLPLPTVVISSIDGMPGIGKTSLAVYLAHILTPNYPDAQLFIDCYGYTPGRQPLNSEQILDSLLHSLGVPIQNIPNNVFGKSALLRSELAHKKSLMVIDNVKSLRQVEAILPGTADCLVLITSRNRLSGLVGSHPLSLSTLNEKESISLVKKISGSRFVSEFKKTLPEVVKHCGYLPLALNIVAGRWKRHNPQNAKLIIDRLKNSTKKLDSFKTGYLAINELFDMSYDSLSDQEKRLFQMMGIHPGLDFTVDACSAMLELDLDSTHGLFEVLVDESLVMETEHGRYRLHDLLREYSRGIFYKSHGKSDEVSSILHLTDYYLAALDNVNKILYPNQFSTCFSLNFPEGVDTNSLNVEQALTWFEAEISNLFSLLEFAGKNKWRMKYWQLSQALASYLRRSISSWRVIEIHSTALSFSEECNDLEKQAASLTELGLVHHEAGNFDPAIELFVKAEKLWKKLTNNEGLAKALNGHGFTLERLGRYTEALNVLNEALKVHESFNNKYGVAFTLNARGAVFWRMGKYDIALPTFFDALKIREEINDITGIASTTNNIAFTHLKLGNIDMANSGFLKSLKLFHDFHDRHGEAVALNNLGYTNIQTKNFKSAIEYSILAREVSLDIGDQYQIGRSYDVQGKALYNTGNKEAALPILQEAFQIFQALNVPEFEEVGGILFKINNSK